MKPKTLQEYGITVQTIQCSNFLKAWRDGKGSARAVLLHGPEGTGKSTLVHILGDHFGWPVLETNASLSHSRAFLDKMWAASRVMPLGTNALKILFFDEIDSLSASQQAQLVEIIRGTRAPIFLACNDFSAIKDELKKACLAVEIGHPDTQSLKRVAEFHGVSYERLKDARSYRDVETILGGGEISRREEVDSIKRAKSIIRGETVPTPSEYWMLNSWVMDNAGDSPIGHYYNLALARYRRHGKVAEKYLHFVLRADPAPEPQFPWSVTFRNSLRKPAPKAPVAREEPEPVKPSKPKKPSPPVQRTADAASFF